jgi:hypothetical protein
MKAALVPGMFALLLALAAPAGAAGLSIEAAPTPGGPASPQMGDRLNFHSTIRNDGAAAMDRVVTWLSLLRVDAGLEQPVDLEDWSAQKAVAASLAPGASAVVAWPVRLIQAGTYRVMVSAIGPDGEIVTSAPIPLSIREKSVVESGRILPVALGIPILIGGILLWRWRRT